MNNDEIEKYIENIIKTSTNKYGVVNTKSVTAKITKCKKIEVLDCWFQKYGGKKRDFYVVCENDSLYNFLNEYVKLKEIPKNILSKSFKIIDQCDHTRFNKKIFNWVDEMIYKYNYKFTEKELNILKKKGYYNQKDNSCNNFIDSFFNEKMIDNYTPEKIKEIIISKKYKININSLINKLLDNQMNNTKSKALILILQTFEFPEDILNNLLLTYFQNLRTKLSYNERYIYEYNFIDEIMKKKFYIHEETLIKLLYDSVNTTVYFKHIIILKILFSGNFKLDKFSIPIYNYILHICYTNIHDNNYTYFECSKNKCRITAPYYAMHLYYKFICKDSNESFIENLKEKYNIDVTKPRYKATCDDKMCKYKISICDVYTVLFCGEIATYITKNLGLVNKQLILQNIKRNYVINDTLISEINPEIGMKYACIYNDVDLIKYYLQNKIIIPTIKHFIYLYYVSKPAIESINLLCSYGLILDKNTADIMLYCSEDRYFNGVYIQSAKKYNQLNEKIITEYKLTTHINTQTDQNYDALLKQELENNNYDRTYPYAHNKQLTINDSAHGFLFVYTYEEILYYEQKIDITKYKNYFELSLNNKDFRVFEYLVEKYNYIPTIFSIMKVVDFCRRYLLMRLFYHQLCENINFVINEKISECVENEIKDNTVSNFQNYVSSTCANLCNEESKKNVNDSSEKEIKPRKKNINKQSKKNISESSESKKNINDSSEKESKEDVIKSLKKMLSKSSKSNKKNVVRCHTRTISKFKKTK